MVGKRIPLTMCGFWILVWSALSSFLVVLFAPFLSQSLWALVFLLVLIRICWIEENIHDDLLKSDRVPNSYLNHQIRRQNWSWRLGLATSDIIECPKRLAMKLRNHADNWWVFFWAWNIAAVLAFSAEMSSVTFWGVLGVSFGGLLWCLDNAAVRGEVLNLSLPLREDDIRGNNVFKKWLTNSKRS